jgi:hypothetical protein
MKTTIDIADPLLQRAKRAAALEGTTLKALIERGLHRVLAEPAASDAAFKLRHASFKGDGLRSELHGADWAQVRDLAYGGHGP